MNIVIDYDLRPSLAGVRDQGPRRTCLAHATSLAHESSRGLRDPLSPEYLHHYAVHGVPATGCGFPAMMDALSLNGQPLESDCPYSQAERDSSWKPPANIQVFRRATEHSIDVPMIRKSIEKGSAVVLGIALPATFLRPAAPWVITSSAKTHGLHAVAAVGWGTRDGKPLVLVRNSWGTTWGDSGHAWLDGDCLTNHLRELLVMREEIN